ncbi:MAG: DUF4271 domain-containing protein [Alistipes sp.]|jgi:hypothetical protein|nr:DUF4271 domain-containing protein [Alistipes sp.]
MPVTFTNIAFQALSLGVLGVFCWMIYTFRAQALHCLVSAVTLKTADAASQGSGDKQRYDNFYGVAMTLGALSVGMGTVKITATALAAGTGTPGTIQWRLAGLAGTAGIEGLPAWTAIVAVMAVALMAAVVVMAQIGLLKAAGGVTLSQKFVGNIVLTKKNWLAAASMFTVPPVAVWTGVNPERDRVTAYVFAIVIVTLAALFIVHTLRGFMKQKVSVLVWFLYLCTVEIFPICAVVLAATKSV